MTRRSKFVWVLLAAGGSKRLGQHKQLLCLGGQSLVHSQTQRLLATQLPVCVIEGAVHLSKQLPKHPQLSALQNPHWQQGINTSIMLALNAFYDCHLGFVLVDQFGIDTLQLLHFYEHWRRGKALVQVSHYRTEKSDAWGVPVIMHQSVCQQLQKSTHEVLRDKSQGLKPWLAANKEALDICMLPWPEAAKDLDTRAQWQAIKHHTSWSELASDKSATNTCE